MVMTPGLGPGGPGFESQRPHSYKSRKFWKSEWFVFLFLDIMELYGGHNDYVVKLQNIIYNI